MSEDNQFLSVMWEIAKNLWANWGTTSFWLSTLCAAVIGVLIWWGTGLILFLSAPRTAAQAQPSPTPTPAIQQSIGNVSGGSTVNQAGGNITINQGVSEEVIRQLLNQKAVSSEAQLTSRYPKGYVLLGVADGKIVYYSDHAPKNLHVDWRSAEIQINKDRTEVWVRMPDMYLEGIDLTMRNNAVGFPYRNGAVQGLALLGENDLKAEVLDAANGILVVGMK